MRFTWQGQAGDVPVGIAAASKYYGARWGFSKRYVQPQQMSLKFSKTLAADLMNLRHLLDVFNHCQQNTNELNPKI